MELRQAESDTLKAVKYLIDLPDFNIDTFKLYLSQRCVEPLAEPLQHPLVKDFAVFNLSRCKAEQKLRGLLDGVFDMTHFGHYNALRQARKLCDELVAAASADDQVLIFKG